MKKIIMLLLIISCNKPFNVEKVLSSSTEISFDENQNRYFYFYEVYLVTSNLEKTKQDSVFKAIMERRINELVKNDSLITDKICFSFDKDTECARDFYERYHKLKRMTGIYEQCYEKCEDNSIDFYSYKKSKEHPNIWISNTFGHSKDTIIIKQNNILKVNPLTVILKFRPKNTV